MNSHFNVTELLRYRTDHALNSVIPNGFALISLNLMFIQLLGINEKEQIMSGLFWVRYKWFDRTLTWDISSSDSPIKMSVPPHMIWTPDTVLYNNADGNFDIQGPNNIILRHNGQIEWSVRAIFSSFCHIKVDYFPFDIQHCSFVLGPWSHDASKVYYTIMMDNATTAVFSYADVHKYIPRNGIYPSAVDLSNYAGSAEWSILENVAFSTETCYHYITNAACYNTLRFELILKRQLLFYAVNFVFPCVAVAVLTSIVFLLPAASCQKITFTVGIFLILTFFNSNLVNLLPPTSYSVPLLGKYLLFTFILVFTSFVANNIVIPLSLRGKKGFSLPRWAQVVFMKILPRLLLIGEPPVVIPLRTRYHRNYELRDEQQFEDKDLTEIETIVYETIKSIHYISQRCYQKTLEEQINAEWNYVAMVIDRLLFGLFLIAQIFGTIQILMTSPTIWHEHNFRELEKLRAEGGNPTFL